MSSGSAGRARKRDPTVCDEGGRRKSSEKGIGREGETKEDGEAGGTGCVSFTGECDPWRELTASSQVMAMKLAGA